MNILYHFLSALLATLLFALSIYKYIVIFSALISWVSPDPYNPVVRFLMNCTVPVYRLIRRILPMSLLRLPIDLSPIVLLILIFFMSSLLQELYYNVQSWIIH